MHHLPLPLPYPAAAAGFRPPPRRRRRKTFPADFSGYNKKRSPPPNLPDPHHHSRSRAVYPLRLPQPPPPSRPSPPHPAAIPSPPRHHSHLHQHCCRHTDAPPPPSSSHPHHLHLHATLIIVTTAAPQQGCLVQPSGAFGIAVNSPCRQTHSKHTAEDDLEVFSTDDLGLDWISAHNFLTCLQKLSSYAFGHYEVSELAACLEKASFSCTSGYAEVF
ncbi:hypothetical protein Tco_1217189 [Tanacetum coccineum]